MGWLSGSKGLGDGEEKNVTYNAKVRSKVKREGKKFVVYELKKDKKGRVTERKAREYNDQNTAEKAARKVGERQAAAENGGGNPGEPQRQGHGKSPAKRAANRQSPGSGKNPHLWKNVNKND